MLTHVIRPQRYRRRGVRGRGTFERFSPSSHERGHEGLALFRFSRQPGHCQGDAQRNVVPLRPGCDRPAVGGMGLVDHDSGLDQPPQLRIAGVRFNTKLKAIAHEARAEWLPPRRHTTRQGRSWTGRLMVLLRRALRFLREWRFSWSIAALIGLCRHRCSHKGLPFPVFPTRPERQVFLPSGFPLDERSQQRKLFGQFSQHLFEIALQRSDRPSPHTSVGSRVSPHSASWCDTAS